MVAKFLSSAFKDTFFLFVLTKPQFKKNGLETRPSKIDLKSGN
jgi:hypothetical protein